MRVPRWMRTLVRWTAPPGRADDLVGDLEEGHRRRLARHGRAVALLLTAGDALGTAAFGIRRGLALGLEGAWLTGSELRLALRLVGRNPLLSLTSVLALAVGMTLATTGFTVLAAVLRPELPFPGGDRLVEIDVLDAETRETVGPGPGLVPALAAAAGPDLAHVGAVDGGPANVAFGPGDVELLDVVRVTPATFRHLPFVPEVGRLLRPGDATGDGTAVALLGRELWERRFGGDPAVVGRRIGIAGETRTVVGVLPLEAAWPASADVWLPLPAAAVEAGAGLSVVGVLGDGASPETARDRLLAVARGWAEGAGAPAVALRVRGVGEAPGGTGPGALLVAALVGLLAVVAANVANLVRARTAARSAELAVRSALGAGRRRLVGQLTLEVLVMGSLAGLLGLQASGWILSLARREGDLPPWIDLSLDLWTVAFVGGLTLLATVVAGVAPALRATRRDLAPALHSGGRGGSRPVFGPLDHGVIVAQIAVSVGVLGAAVMVHQGWMGAYGGAELGIAPESVLSARLTRPGPARPDTAGQRAAGPRDAPARVGAALAALEGVEAVGLTTHLPGWDAPFTQVAVEGAAPADGDLHRVRVAAAGPGLFGVLGVATLAGRELRASDAEPGAPEVVVVNHAFVEEVLGGRQAVGRRIRLAAGDAVEGAHRWREIVGVVPDLGLSSSDPETRAGVYTVLEAPASWWVLLRTDGPAAELAPAVRTAVFDVDPALTATLVEALSVRIQERRRVYVVMGSVFTGLGGLVLLLSLMGIYALLSFEVTRRTREIGVRVALGAETGDVLRPVLARVGAYAAAGGLLGTLLGAVLLDLLRGTLVMRFPATGPGAFLALVGLVAVAAGLAAVVPARRALAVHPMDALRAE